MGEQALEHSTVETTRACICIAVVASITGPVPDRPSNAIWETIRLRTLYLSRSLGRTPSHLMSGVVSDALS